MAMEQRRLGPYTLLERLGAGGMGEVFLARHTETGARVALKVLVPAAADDGRLRDRFRREARAVSMLSHPGIARVLEWGEEAPASGGEPTLYFAMELVSGEDPLRRFSVTPPTTEVFVDLMVQLASALEAAHRAGVIHRDLKPANVKIDEHGRVRILDFGLAKIEGDGDPNSGTTARGRLVGTTPYVAPELFEGGSAGPASDMFSLGVLLYQTFTGRLPFSGASMIDYLHDIATRRPDPMSAPGSELPPEVEAVVRRLLSRSPDRRYGSASELLNDLRRLAAPAPEPSEAPTLAGPRPVLPPPPERSPERAIPWRPILAGLLLLAVIALVLWAI